ncbi:phage terminase small subunit P27 family [Halalkalibacterium halodurans]|uniref:phage terminase small subunit P27 family n=1 Tax=Halalkalibacterium halodurans TaxID=86665 RepID=UPI002E23D172|nr:phage terminase small subunit P27 family [Halalkalibacterium halodurans]
MAGRPRQPLEVIKGKGRSNHLTKAEIKEREEQEKAIRGNTDKIIAPSYLTKKQQEEFYKIAEELVEMKLFSNLDVDGLARYIDSRDLYIKVVRELRSIKPTSRSGNDKLAVEDFAKLQRTKNLLFNECKSAASELGLSITSRLKLVIPKADPPKHTPSEFEKKFGDV